MKGSKPNRRFWRFGLRFVFVLLSFAGLVFAFYSSTFNRTKIEQATLEREWSGRHNVKYEHDFASEKLERSLEHIGTAKCVDGLEMNRWLGFAS